MSNSNKEIKIKVSGDSDNIINTPAKYIGNLVDQIESDIFPLLFFTKGHAPFTVLRNLFCFLDHATRLRYGNDKIKLGTMFEKSDPSNQKNKKNEKFGAYKHIQKRYFEVHPFLIQMYRHELVHHIRPFPKFISFEVINSSGDVVEAGTQRIGFNISPNVNKKLIKSSLESFDQMYNFMKKEKNRTDFGHLRSFRNPKTLEYESFVFNVLCFMFDVVEYLKRYIVVLKKDRKEQESFVRHYQSIIKSNLTRPQSSLILDKTRITQTDIEESETDANNDQIKEWYGKMREILFTKLENEEED